MDFMHEVAPVAQRVGLVEDEIGAAADGAPFLYEDGPGGANCGLDLVGGGVASPAFGGEVGDFVFHQRAGQAEVVTGCGEEAMPALGIPACDAVFEFGRAVEVDFLSTLDDPVLEDAVAARAGVALDCGRVRTAALEGARDDSGVGAEGVEP